MADSYGSGHDDPGGAAARTFGVTLLGGVLFVTAFFFVLL